MKRAKLPSDSPTYYRTLWFLAILIDVGIFIALVIIQADHVLDISIYVVGIPFYVLAFFALIVYLWRAFFEVNTTLHRRMLDLGFCAFLIGMIATYLEVSAKSVAKLEATYLYVFAPWIAGSGIALILTIGSIFAVSREQELEITPPKWKPSPPSQDQHVH